MPRFQNAPIDRHDALAPLSRDHYAGLVQARHLLKAADGDAIARRKALAEFVDAWEQQIADHFADEERLLSDHLSTADRTALLEQHRQLSAEAATARRLRRQVDPDADALRRIGRALENHIRWEERELFTRLQATLDASALTALGQQTQAIERRRGRRTGKVDR